MSEGWDEHICADDDGEWTEDECDFCPECAGAGVWHDCGMDCVCPEPVDNMYCDFCDGEGVVRGARPQPPPDVEPMLIARPGVCCECGAGISATHCKWLSDPGFVTSTTDIEQWGWCENCGKWVDP